MNKKMLIAGAIFLAMPLAACSTISKFETQVQTLYQKLQLAWKGAPKTIYTLESGYTILQTAAATFKATECPSVTSLGGKCATIVPKLRTYNARALTILRNAEDYVRSHPDLNNTNIIIAAEDAISQISKDMTALGVKG